jgi:tryptophanyl-tRNA synthetase
VFKQYREADGQFYVKLTLGDEVLALSPGFASGRDGAQWLVSLKAGGAATLAQQGDAAALAAALATLREQDAEREKTKEQAKAAKA